MKERVRAIIKNGNAILLIHRIKKGREYWVFPGGGVENTDKNKETALVRECREELGVEVQVGNLLTRYELGESDEKQCEYFYFCEIIGGILGTGAGPEFQNETNYEGLYALEWVPLDGFLLKSIQPEEVKKKLLEKSRMLIAINGVDGVGKSQQIKLLHFFGSDQLSFTKSLTEYSMRWPKLETHAMFDWWFKEVKIEDFLAIMIESLNKRNSEFVDSIVILDRGTLMFKAVCAATISIRTGSNLMDSMNDVDLVFTENLNYCIEDEHNILLQPDVEYQKSITPYISLLQNESSCFTAEENEFYSMYQKLLKEAMDYYFNNAATEKIKVNSSICETQNKLRLLINKISKLSLSEILSSVRSIIGFGGLSECGKSGFAEHLRKNNGYYRLKLGYFVEILKRRGEDDTPENIAMEFLHFCKTHYYVQGFTIESLHEPYTPAFLKLLFGIKFQIVYLDASFEVRCNRASVELDIPLSEAREKTKQKDQVKKSRGAEMVSKIADINFNNSDGGYSENILKFEQTLVF
jgi:8-oxo-dGTP diphosphatase